MTHGLQETHSFWRRLLEYIRASWELLNATYGQMNQAFSNLIWALSATILIDCCKDSESFGSWVTQLPNSLFYKHQFKYERENSINWGTPPLLLIIWLNEATLWKGLPWLVFPEEKKKKKAYEWGRKNEFKGTQFLNDNLCHFHYALLLFEKKSHCSVLSGI